MGWIFATRSMQGHGQYESSALPALHVTLETAYEWRRFPPRAAWNTSVTLVRFLDRPSSGTWVNGRYVGPAARRERTLTWSDDADPSEPDEIEAAVAEVVGPDADEDAIVAHARAIRSLVGDVLQGQANGQLDPAFLLAWSGGPLRNGGNGGGSGRNGAAGAAFVATLIIVIASGWIGVRFAAGSCRTGWRLPREGEWERVLAEQHR